MIDTPTPVRQVLDRLKNVKQNGKGWTARCPAHQDRQNSLSIGVGDDERVLLKCFAGCDVAAIAQALGLDMKALFPDQGGGGVYSPQKSRATPQHPHEKPLNSSASDHCNGSSDQDNSGATAQYSGCTLAQYAKAKCLPEGFLQSLGITDIAYMGAPALRIPYFDREGEITAIRFRIGLDIKDKFRWRRGNRPSLYGLNRITGTPGYVVLVEGESDCHALWHHGEPALGLPGAANWNEDRDAWIFDGIGTVYIVHEGDKGGEAIEGWLPRSRIRDRAKLVSLAKFKVKDPAALHAENPERFKECWQEALAEATPWTDREAEATAEEREKAWGECAALAKADDILSLFVREYRRVVVGEDRTAKLLYLALTSRILKRPVSVAVKGPSSGGKSFVTETALRFFPESAYHSFTAMSERALAYGEYSISHKFLVICEASGMEGDMQSYLIRSLLSENRLVYEFVEKTKNGLKLRRIEREGPTGLLVTTTAIRLHPENETRLLSVLVTDSQEQTKAVMQTLADEDIEDPECKPWQALQSWLESGPREVTIPYSRTLVQLIPPSAVRLRRDFGAILSLIRAHALLHQETRSCDDRGRVVATFDDYGAVREIVAALVADAVEATVRATVRETVNATKEIIGSEDKTVSLANLMQKMGLDRSTVSRRVREAKSGSYLKNLETKRGMPSKLVLGDPMPEDKPILPEVDDLVLQCCGVVRGDKHPPSPPCEAKTCGGVADGNGVSGGEECFEDDSGDAEERRAIQEFDGEFDPVKDRPGFLNR